MNNINISGINKNLVEAEALKKALINDILNLPSNPNINIITDKTYTINLKTLSDNLSLSPRHYFFPWQYKEIADILSDTPLEKLETKLSDIIQRGKLGPGQMGSTDIHQDVIKHLKTLIGVD